MKATTSKKDLRFALECARRATPGKTTMPVLHDVLVAAETENGGSLRLTATDLEMTIAVRVPAMVARAGAVAVPAHAFADYVKALEDAPIELNLDEAESRLVVKCGKQKGRFKGIPASEYPTTPDMENAKPLAALPAAEFRQGITQTVFAAVPEKEAMGAPTTGVRFVFEPGRIEMQSTDTYRVSKRVFDATTTVDEAVAAIVPAGVLRRLLDVVKAGEVEMALATGDNQIVFRVEASDAPRIDIAVQLIWGNFPDISRVVPVASEVFAEVSTAELRQAVALARLFSNYGGAVHVEVGNGKCSVRLPAQETGNAMGELDARTEGDPAEYHFCVDQLAEALDAFVSEKITLRGQDAEHPCLFRSAGEGDDGFIHVLMPLTKEKAVSPRMETTPHAERDWEGIPVEIPAKVRVVELA